MPSAGSDPSLRHGPARPERRPDVGYIAQVTILGTNELGWVELRPTHSRMLQANTAKGRHLAWAVNTLQTLCGELGTKSEVSRGGLRIAISASPPVESAPKRRVPRAREGSGAQSTEAATARQQQQRQNARAAGRAPDRWWAKFEDDDDDDGGALGEGGGVLRRAWAWVSSLVGRDELPNQRPSPSSPRVSHMIEPVTDGEALGVDVDLDSSDVPVGRPSPVKLAGSGRPSPMPSPLRSPTRHVHSPHKHSPSSRKHSPRWSPNAKSWSPGAGVGVRFTAVANDEGDDDAGEAAAASTSADGARDDDDGGGWRDRHSPGMRRGGRLGSPKSPSGGGGRSLWGWADAGAPPSSSSAARSAGGRSDAALLRGTSSGGGSAAAWSDDDDDDDDGEQRVPLSVLMRSLSGQ